MRREYLSALATAGLVACFLGPLEAKPLEVVTKQGSLQPRIGGLRQLQELAGFGADPNNLPLDLCQGDCDTNDDVSVILICADVFDGRLF